MPQFARPSRDWTVTSVTGTPVNNNNRRWENVGELVPSDTTFAYGANDTAATHTVGLGAVTDPATSAGHAFRDRIAKMATGVLSATGAAVSVTVTLMQSTTVIAADTARVVDGTWTLYERILTAAEADAITDYGTLRLRMTTTASGGVVADRRGGAWAWAGLEVPSVTVSALDKATIHYGLINSAPNRRFSWTDQGISFTASDPTLVGDVLSCVVEASDGNGPLPVDNRYQWVNPPLMVPDGGQAWAFQQGAPVLVTTFKRDDIPALKAIVYDAVTGYALRHGWTP